MQYIEITELTRLLKLVTDFTHNSQQQLHVKKINKYYTLVYLYVKKCIWVQVNKCVVVKFI